MSGSSVDIDYAAEVAQLVTLRDLVRYAVSAFHAGGVYFGHGTDDPWVEAVELVHHVLYLPSGWNSDMADARVTLREKQLFIELLQRRIRERVPLAYLTQHIRFAGLPFYVDERVLVPRSPIAELINNRFEPHLPLQPQRILDLCTGSACIALALASVFTEADVDAVDLDADALEVAAINVQMHQLESRVVLLQGDVFDAVAGQRYDLIVSNPPYVDADDMASLPEEFRHEPELGLAAGDDGLDIVRRILAQAEDHLTEQGVLVVEVGNSQLALSEAYPELPFQWLEFSSGEHGIFLLHARDLRACRSQLLHKAEHF